MNHPSESLPISSPSREGIDPRGIASFVDALESMPGVETHSLMILRHGALVATGWWWPYTKDQLQLLYSVSKSFTSTALGIAVDEGLVRLDDSVITYFPELNSVIPDKRSRSIRVRDVAAMASGHLEDTWPDVESSFPENPVHGFLSLPPERDPGSIFTYNQSASYALAAIVQRVSGQTVTQFLRTRVLDPIGAGPVVWWEYPMGQDLGFSGLHATTDTIARLGQLYLENGSWRGRHILSTEWVHEASAFQIATKTNDPAPDVGIDAQRGYGFQFWQSRHGYRADGAYGQFCLVLPEYDAVIAMTGQSTQTQDILDAVWQILLPAFTDESGDVDDDADRALEERLTNLRLPVFPGQCEPSTQAARWDNATFYPTGDSCHEQPSITSMHVWRNDDGWRFEIHEGDWPLSAPLLETWIYCSSQGEVQPILSNGGWSPEGLLEVSLIFIESPHRLNLTCNLGEQSVAARWVTPPLHPGPMRDLRVHRAGPVTWLQSKS